MFYLTLIITLFYSGDYNWFKNEMLAEVNSVRSAGCYCGNVYYKPVPKVVWNDKIAMAAAKHAIDMYQKNYFSHQSLDGRNLGDRIDAQGYRWKRVAENIARGQASIEGIVSGWVKSPSHCRNIMDPQLKHMGVAKKGRYWVQDFGTAKPVDGRAVL